MANILMLSSAVTNAAVAIYVSRGMGAANLLTHDPKEVWQDSAVGSIATITIDLGAPKAINTIALAAIYGAIANSSSWSITGGIADSASIVIKADGYLPAVDAAGQNPNVSHALWTGAAVTVRYVSVNVWQPSGNPALKIGRILVGDAFQPTWNQEWGGGRGVIDTGASTRLLSGGMAIVEGARLGTYAWTLGDLTDAEVETLYALQLEVGETLPVLVVEDPDATTGQRNRIHYGRLVSLRKFERRSPGRTRWELAMEDWI